MILTRMQAAKMRRPAGQIPSDSLARRSHALAVLWSSHMELIQVDVRMRMLHLCLKLHEPLGDNGRALFSLHEGVQRAQNLHEAVPCQHQALQLCGGFYACGPATSKVAVSLLHAALSFHPDRRLS